ncbi:MAG: carboxypeptidase regulatory-like domain-containing protein [Sedimentisphaerales bacterium]
MANVSVSGIVVDQFDQPISNIRIYGYGNGQPSMRETYTNTKGRFTLENMCQGQINIQANMQEPERLHGRATARGGDTDIKIVVSLINSEGRLVPREPASLVKKSLPAFENIDIGFSPEQVRDKRILICFWDNEQRPSRNCIQELNKKTEELKQKDIAVVTIHASKVEREYLDNWLKENNISFLIGIIDNEVEKTRFDWSVKALPWLILTDKEHIVQAEGFSINELDERIKN